MINWGSLLVVQLVSFVATITVVVLTSLAVLGLSARGGTAQHAFSARSGTAVAATCLVAAATIVLFGLWEIVAR